MLLLLACVASHPTDSPAVGSLLAGPGSVMLRINEVQARNDSTIMDEPGSFPDWFELYNAGSTPISLSDVSASGLTSTWTGNKGEIPPGATHLVLGKLNLDAGGDVIDLYVKGERVDGFATGQMDGDVSWARFPDGGDWDLSARPTPGWTNGSASPDSNDPSDALFRIESAADIHSIELSLSEESMTSLDNQPYAEVLGSLAFEGAWFPAVNVRRKGVYGSLRTMEQKVGLKVDVNDYEPHRLRGERVLSINNMVQDPSYIHETMAYLVWRSCGVPAPRTGYTRLSINGEHIGFYVLVETVNEDLLAHWFADPTGNLYEGAYGVDFYDGYEYAFECDQCANPDDRSDLTAVIDVLDEDASEESWADLQKLWDMDEFLTYMAVEAMLWHWDGYTTSNNYRIYHDPKTDRFQMLPWGSDQTWKDESYGPYDARGRLFQWCMTWPDCKSLYQEKMLIMADVLEGLAMPARMNALLKILGPDMADDPRREFDDSTHQSWVDATLMEARQAPDRMRAAAAQ